MRRWLLVLLALLVLQPPAAEAAELLVSDRANDSIKRYDGITGAYKGDFVPPGRGGLHWPEGITWGPDGNLYVSSTGSGKIIRYDGLTGAYLGDFVPPDSGGLREPVGLVFRPDGYLYVSSFGTGAILRYNGSTGAFVNAFVSSGPNSVSQPVGLAFGPDGNLYVDGFSTHEVRRYDGRTGAFNSQFVPNNGSLDRPIGLTFGPDGNLYVSGGFLNQISRYNGVTGALMGAFIPPNSGGLGNPQGLTFGPDGNLYVSTTGAILRYDGLTGAFKDRFATGGGLAFPYMMTFSPLGGELQAPGQLDCGPVRTGFSKSFPLVLRNNSNFSAMRMRIDASAAPFSLTGGSRTVGIPPGGFVTLTVNFQPTALGAAAGSINLDTGDPARLGLRIALSGTGVDRLPPAAPGGLTAAAVSESQIDLAWQDNSSDEELFEIERNTANGAFVAVGAVGGNKTAFSDTGLAPNTAYTYRIRATAASLASDYSNESPGLTFPSTPLGLQASVLSATSIRLSWTDANPVPAAVRIERAPAGGDFTQLGTAPAGSTAYLDSGLQDGNTYRYRIRATNGSGPSAYSSTVEASIPVTPPNAPDRLVVTRQAPGSLTLTWRDNSSNETGFDVERRSGGGPFTKVTTTASNATTFTDTGLAPNTTYTYHVRAVVGETVSGYSNEVTVLTLPATPAGLRVGTVSVNSVELVWVDANPTPTGVRIERATATNDFVEIGRAASGSATYLDSGLQDGVSYRYRVRATNASGDSDYSAELEVTTPIAPPAAPTGLSVSLPNLAAQKLTWQDNSTLETGFEIERSRDGVTFAPLATVAAGATSYQDSGLAPGTTYWYRVRAIGGGEPSAYSNTASGGTWAAGGTLSANSRVSFGVVRVGRSKRNVLLLRNLNRTSPLKMRLGSAVTPFSGAGGEFTIPAKGRLQIPLTFTPGARGAASGSIVVISSDPAHASVTVTLQGSGR